MKRSGLSGLGRAGAGGAMVLAVFLLAGCATGPGAHPRDPLEPWNRGIFRFNDAVIRSVTIRCDQAITEASPLKKDGEGKPAKRMREELPEDDDDSSDDE